MPLQGTTCPTQLLVPSLHFHTELPLKWCTRSIVNDAGSYALHDQYSRVARCTAALSIPLHQAGGCGCNHPCTLFSATPLRCAASPHLTSARLECALTLGGTWQQHLSGVLLHHQQAPATVAAAHRSGRLPWSVPNISCLHHPPCTACCRQLHGRTQCVHDSAMPWPCTKAVW